MMAVRPLRSIVIAVALCVPAAAPAKAPPRYGALVYSSLCVAAQSGDIGGTRITLLRLGDGDKVIYEYTEGAVMWPLFAVRAKIDSKAGTIGFDVRLENETLTFIGKFTDTVLTGTFGGKNEPLRLFRITDLSRPTPPCS